MYFVLSVVMTKNAPLPICLERRVERTGGDDHLDLYASLPVLPSAAYDIRLSLDLEEAMITRKIVCYHWHEQKLTPRGGEPQEVALPVEMVATDI